jgi:hypothetical protein
LEFGTVLIDTVRDVQALVVWSNQNLTDVAGTRDGRTGGERPVLEYGTAAYLKHDTSTIRVVASSQTAVFLNSGDGFSEAGKSSRTENKIKDAV